MTFSNYIIYKNQKWYKQAQRESKRAINILASNYKMRGYKTLIRSYWTGYGNTYCLYTR